MFERNISARSVAHVIRSGETVEDYSAEMAEPGQLLLGFQGKRPVHVVVSENQKTNIKTVITVYSPDPVKWDKNFTRRRS
jgi:hypothetical protein